MAVNLDASQRERASLMSGAAEQQFEQELVEKLIAVECDDATSRGADVSSIARRVQRTSRQIRSDIACTISGEQEGKLVLAATHHWRAKMHVRLSHLYTDKAWESKKFPRKFYIKYRGFGPTHQRDDLAEFRKMYLRCALSNALRAVELAPFSYECVMLKACILCLLVGFGGYTREMYCEDALIACRRAMSLHRMPQIADDRERAILYNSTSDRDGPRKFGSGRSQATMTSLWDMAIFAAHTVAVKRGGWDADTMWANRGVATDGGRDDKSVPHRVNTPTTSLEELVGWNMWSNNWSGIDPHTTVEGVLDSYS